MREVNGEMEYGKKDRFLIKKKSKASKDNTEMCVTL